MVSLNASNPCAVKWWNLQCYAGGQGNDPAEWANAITAALPEFDTTSYILVSDWSRFWNSSDNQWEGDCPAAVQSLLAPFGQDACVGGGFIWTIDQIIDYAADSQKKSRPKQLRTCRNV